MGTLRLPALLGLVILLVATSLASIGYPPTRSASSWAGSVAPLGQIAQGRSGAGPIAISAVPVGMYQLTFVAHGLPNGTPWSVVLDGSANSSSTSSIGFTAQNGSHSYSIGPTPGFATARNLSVTIAGAPRTVNVTFSRVTFPVTFREVGLAPGAVWGVTIAATLRNASGASLVVAEPNGTYSYTVSPVPGYGLIPGGVFIVNGTGEAVATFGFVVNSTIPGQSRSPLLLVEVSTLVAALGIAGLVAVVLRGRGRVPSSDPPGDDPAVR